MTTGLDVLRGEPPKIVRGKTRGFDWEQIIEALQERPGEMVLLRMFAGVEGVKSLHTTVTQKRNSVLRREDGELRAATRNTTIIPGHDRTGDLYLGWFPNPKED
jgi:hypothetical protein